MIQVEGIFSGGSSISAPIIGEDFNWTGGDGTYQVIEGKPWKIKFLSSGSFTPLKNMNIDAFLVGAGGGCGRSYCGSGGAGYTTTGKSIVLMANTIYPIVIGGGGTTATSSSVASSDGGNTTAFSLLAEGGKRSPQGDAKDHKPGGAGGSGGGGELGSSGKAEGGTDGSDGATGSTAGGKGQGTTTREFGEADGDLYASGGGSNLTMSIQNSGNGGSYYNNTTIAAADGIVIIRQHKEETI
jgi:hypothetical protein